VRHPGAVGKQRTYLVYSSAVPENEVGLRVALGWRPIPARIGEEHILAQLLRQHGCQVTQTQDARPDLSAFDIILLLENCGWFPKILDAFGASRNNSEKPLLVVWHWEPLPLPAGAGASEPRLSLREIAKILLRDTRATDPYTNLRKLRQLKGKGLPLLLVVSSQAWAESMAERGISAHWVPYGYDASCGSQSSGEPNGERDIEALFLGALEIPRRRKIIQELRRKGVKLEARGSWTDKELWGEQRNGLIHRAEAFLNIQRYPREIGAHRLILGMANRSLVVSEPIYRPEPFLAGKHYVEAEVREMPDVLRYYHAHPEERAEIVEMAYQFVTGALKMEESVARILSLVNEVRRAPSGTQREGKQ
jgi:hypothetical protein